MATKDDAGLDIIPEVELEDEGGADEEIVPKYLMPGWLYDILKWVALLICPAAAVLVSHVGNAWGLPNADQIAITIVEVGLFIGGCIGVSHVSSMGR